MRAWLIAFTFVHCACGDTQRAERTMAASTPAPADETLASCAEMFIVDMHTACVSKEGGCAGASDLLGNEAAAAPRFESCLANRRDTSDCTTVLAIQCPPEVPDDSCAAARASAAARCTAATATTP